MIAPGTSIFLINSTGNVRVDNLCLKYTGWHCFKMNCVHDITITNCEIGWIGGAGESSRWGNAIEFWGKSDNCLVDNNWLYEVYDTALTNQYSGVYDIVSVANNITYSNNLVEYCSFTFEFFSNQYNSNRDIMKNIKFVNNISRFIGYGWGENNRPRKGTSCHLKGWRSKNRVENFVIADNIFFDANFGTLNFASEPYYIEDIPRTMWNMYCPQYSLELDNNLYVNKAGESFSDYQKTTYYYNHDMQSEFIRDNVDVNARVILLDKEDAKQPSTN